MCYNPGEISPKQQKKRTSKPLPPNLGEIPQQKTQQLGEPITAGEGIIVNLNGEDGPRDLPQVDTVEHYLDDNFSDVYVKFGHRIKCKFLV